MCHFLPKTTLNVAFGAAQSLSLLRRPGGWWWLTVTALRWLPEAQTNKQSATPAITANAVEVVVVGGQRQSIRPSPIVVRCALFTVHGSLFTVHCSRPSVRLVCSSVRSPSVRPSTRPLVRSSVRLLFVWVAATVVEDFAVVST